MLVCQCSIAGERCHCFVSRIVQCGGSVKDSMEPARHHDADLTFGRCAHTRLEDLSKVLDRLPDLRVSHTLPTQDIQIGFSAWSRKGLNDDSELITAKD